MASIFDFTDDPPKKTLPVRETPILPPPNINEIRRQASLRLLPEVQRNAGARQDVTRVDPNALAVMEARDLEKKIREVERDMKRARVVGDIEIEGPEWASGQQRIAKAAAFWSAASVGERGFDQETYDKAMLLMDYMFAPLDTKEKWDAYQEWALSGASYEDMPPGAMSPELLVGMTKGPGDLQALRDIWKDLKHGQQDWFTALDALSLLPVAGVLFGMVRQMEPGGDMAKLAARLYRKANMAEEVGMVRVVPQKYGSGHTFVFATPTGNVIADISLSRKMVDGVEIPEAHVDIIHREGEHIDAKQAQAIGTKAMIEIGAQLREVFPGHLIGGFRVSGMRQPSTGKLGIGGGSKGTFKSLDTFPAPATEDIMSANSEALELVNARRVMEGKEPVTVEQMQEIAGQREQAWMFRDRPESRPLPANTTIERKYLDNRADMLKRKADQALQGGMPVSTEVDHQRGRITVTFGEGDDAMSMTIRDDPSGGNPRQLEIESMSENFDPTVWDQIKSRDDGNMLAYANGFSFPRSFSMPSSSTMVTDQTRAAILAYLRQGETPENIRDALFRAHPDWTDQMRTAAANEVLNVRDQLVQDGGLHFDAGPVTEAGPRTRRPRERAQEKVTVQGAGEHGADDVLDAIDRLEDYWQSGNMDPAMNSAVVQDGIDYLVARSVDPELARALANMDEPVRDLLFESAMERTNFPSAQTPSERVVPRSGPDDQFLRRRAEALGDYRDLIVDPELNGREVHEALAELGYSPQEVNQALHDYGNTRPALGSPMRPDGSLMPTSINELERALTRTDAPVLPPISDQVVANAGARDAVARTVVGDLDGNAEGAARILVADHGMAPEEAIIAVNRAMDTMGYGANGSIWTRDHGAAITALRRLWDDTRGEVRKSIPDPGDERLWRRAEELRAEGVEGDELLRRLEGEGFEPDAARRITGLGKEAQGQQIGGTEPMIGAREERRAAERAPIDEAGQERAARMLEDWDVPLEREGAEPAHWEVLRRAARGEGGEPDFDQMQEVQDGFTRRQSGESYEDVANPGLRLRESVSADDFYASLARAQEVNPRVNDYHTPRTLAEWKALEADGAKFILNENGTAGGAVLPDGDIVNLFNAGGPRGVVVNTMLPEAIRQGGTKADWFDGRLSELYEPYMDVHRTDPFDPQYGPGPGGEPADVKYGRVKPEVRERLGNPMTERELTEHSMEMIQNDPEAMAKFEDDYVSGLSPGERERWERSNRGVKKSALEAALKQQPPEEIAALVAFGAPNRGWYAGVDASNAAAALRATFGEDAYQYAALLAATSPNVPVPANSRFASDMFTEWVMAGRPTDEDAIKSIFDMVRQNQGENTARQMDQFGEGKVHQVETSALPNTLFVLQHPDPVGHFGNPENWVSQEALGLSGAKVNPFLANLAGEMRRFTNDTHMTRGSAQHYNNLSNRAAQESTYTRAGSHLEEVLGLQPGMILAANGQEMGWEVLRQLGVMSGRGRQGIEELMFPGGGPMDMDFMQRLNENVTQAGIEGGFDSLLQQEETARNLQRAGFTPENAPPVERGLGSPELDRQAQEWALREENWPAWRRIARRMDMHYGRDYLNQAAPWLVGGAAAQGARRILPAMAEEQDQQTPALLQGVGLPFGPAPNQVGGRPDDRGIPALGARSII